MSLAKFRAIRKCWMGLSVLLSISTIILAASLSTHLIHKSDIGLLAGIPSLAATYCLWTIVRSTFMEGRVLVEIIWTALLLPLEIALGLFSASISIAKSSTIALRLLFALRSIIWINYGFITIYLFALTALSILTHNAFDADVWTRDIDADPSPFPLSTILVYALPATTRFFPTTPKTESDHALCVPGCTCTRKLVSPNATPRPVFETEMQLATREAYVGGNVLSRGTRSEALVRLPTDMERRRSIIVAFDGLGNAHV